MNVVDASVALWVGLGHELLQTAAEISIQYRLSGYDGIYASTARLLGGQWLTFDLGAVPLERLFFRQI